MAVIKHIANKNSNYGESERYLIFQHNEYTQKPILDEEGHMILREEYYLDGLNCDPFSFASECQELNSYYHKNKNFNEIKSHHYIISFDPKDRDECVPELAECKFRVACDVTNPLCGEFGCSSIYGPQKGATPEMIQDMDQWLGAYAELAKERFPKADPKYPGTGAAGGMGFAFLTFTDAVLESGINIVLDETKLEDYIKDADLVITGEGRMDGQTAMGKAPVGVAKLAKKYGKKVIAFAGAVQRDARACNDAGIDAFFPILRGVVTLEEAMKNENAKQNLADTTEQVIRLMK